MFTRMTNGWNLARQSWNVLMLDKELLLFPIISGFCSLLVLASFIVPLFLAGGFDAVLNEDGIRQGVTENPLAYVVMFAFYFANYFVITFFNSALVACAVIRFKGGDPTVVDGLNAAWKRLPQIAGWSLLAATIGMILKSVESRSENVAKFVTGLLGAAWSITSFFVIPVLVVEKTGPIDSFKRSFSIIRKTWGEALTANFGIGFLSFLATVVAIIPIVGGGYLCATGMVPVGIALIAVGVIGIILVALVHTTLDAIVVAALYLYASEGEVLSNFDNSLLQNAFTNR